MINEFQHLLTKHGILTSFNIAKRIKKSQINTIRKRLEKKGLNAETIEEEIDKQIINNTKKFLEEHEIPGLEPGNSEIKINPKKQKKLVKLSNDITLYCESNDFTKEDVIILVQAIFHILKITNSDVQRFKEKYNLDSDSDDDYLDEDDNDEF
jgi:hypothetical protein